MSSKVTTWSQELCNLSEIARSQPQAAYSALVHGLQHKWSFLCRVLQVTSDHLAPMEDLIHHRVIPAITGRVAPSEVERLLLTFPCRHGGLGISDHTSLGAQYTSSRRITTSLRDKIMEQAMHIGDAQASVRTTKSKVRSETRTTLKAAVDAFRISHDDWELAISLAEEKSASSWLTCRPISRHGFALSKAEFRDGL